MKKLILASIGISMLFATYSLEAQCYFNYPYNGQRVTYCVGNNEYDYQYYYNNNYNSSYYNYYNINSNYSYSNYYNENYSRNNVYQGPRTQEENYYNLLYMNGLEGPGDKVKTPDFFLTNVISNEIELSKIDDINIKNFSFKYASNTLKYENSKKFVEVLKNQIKTRYLEGLINRSGFYSSLEDLETLVFHLNEQYTNTSIYDKTGKVFYKNLALDNLVDVNRSYEKLKFTLGNL